MRVQEIICSKPIAISAHIPLRSAIAVLFEYQQDCLPVVKENKIFAGVLDLKIVIGALQEGRDVEQPTRQMVKTGVPTCSPEDRVAQIVQRFDYDILPVISDGKLLGVVYKETVRQVLGLAREEGCAVGRVDLGNAFWGAITVDCQGKVTLCNSNGAKMLGVNANTILGQPLNEFLPIPNLDHLLSCDRPTYGLTFNFGVARLQIDTSPIMEKDRLSGMAFFFRDTVKTGKIRNEIEYARNLNKELTAIIETSYDGITVTDKHGLMLRVNQSYEKITGISPVEILGNYVSELVKKGYFNQSVVSLVIQEKKPVTILQRIIKIDKEVIVTGNPVFNEAGEIVKVVTNVRDITELNSYKSRLKKYTDLNEKYLMELEHLRQQLFVQNNVIARSKEMQQVLDQAMRVAQVDCTALITGESGVGKEIVAKIIHNLSPRKDRPFIKINCGAIPDNLLETELFGYEGGAFTGANQKGKQGLIEVANGGTLFLDEIGELPLPLQVKLLRVLQDREVLRVGGTHSIKVDIRVISATNKDLKTMVLQKQFREDLFYRLNVVPINIPPLRDRKSDIFPLINFFLGKYCEKYGRQKQLTQETIAALTHYHWPGNVRELENVIEQVVVLSLDETIALEDIPVEITGNVNACHCDISISEVVPLKEAVEVLQKKLILKAIEQFRSTQKAAEVLGIHRTTLVRKAQQYSIKCKSERTGGEDCAK